MNYLTAKFIHSFKSNGLEKVLQSYLLEEVAKIENLSTLPLDSESDYQLRTCILNDFPAFQKVCIQTQHFDISVLSSSLDNQLHVLKQNINTIYLHSIESLKKDAHLQEKIFVNKHNNLQAYLGGGQVRPKLDNDPQVNSEHSNIMDNFTGFDFNNTESLQQQGLQILQEDNLSETWQNKFTSMSERVIENKEQKIIDTPSKLDTPYINNEAGMMDTGHWIILGIIFSIILSIIVYFFI